MSATTSAVVAGYWSTQYTDADALAHHRRQNATLAHDFLSVVKRMRELPGNPGGKFNNALRGAHSVIEIGCGTGELAAAIDERYCPAVTYATDLSLDAVKAARQMFPKVRFEVFDILDHWPTPLGGFTVAVASNVLEHFRDWTVILDRMLVLAEKAIVVVPYRQAVRDGYAGEGGAGHVVCFTKASFKRYRVLDAFTFETRAWVHRSGAETPRQLALLIGRR